ncbi:MAG: ferredoxin [Rhodocyclaceae bacterium]|nr:MAG: ferredoxin [Rhodocyclaceae bacterium]
MVSLSNHVSPAPTFNGKGNIMREGNLQAPTRHPIDWKNPDFYDEASCEKELERIFDICHGCRRCVSLCNAFPMLFDLIDEAGDLETAGVPKEKFWKVVDQCYLCDVCYMTKCPYVPPHEWNLDFPHTMLRAKAIQYRVDGHLRLDSDRGACRECREQEWPGASRDAKGAGGSSGPRAARI